MSFTQKVFDPNRKPWRQDLSQADRLKWKKEFETRLKRFGPEEAARLARQYDFLFAHVMNKHRDLFATPVGFAALLLPENHERKNKDDVNWYRIHKFATNVANQQKPPWDHEQFVEFVDKLESYAAGGKKIAKQIKNPGTREQQFVSQLFGYTKKKEEEYLSDSQWIDRYQAETRRLRKQWFPWT